MTNKDFHVENILGNPYIGKNDDDTDRIPTPRQAIFLCNKMNQSREVLFGGAAGGGKSDAILMAALQYVHVPKYSALILRKTFADLSLPGAIMDRAHDWLAGSDAHWDDKTKTYTFPSGANLTFGYLDSVRDHFRYQGAEFQFIAFDELTQFPVAQYKYLFSRLRRLKGSKVPIRMRAGSNPGGVGHSWVKDRFIDNPLNTKTKQYRKFVKSKIADNPYLDREEYELSLMELGPLERRQLLDGDWNAAQLGNKFRRSWVRMITSDQIPYHRLRTVRYWDLAATEPAKGKEPDYTVGVKMGYDPETHYYYILDVVRVRETPGGVIQTMLDTAARDGVETQIRMEREGGSAGKIVGYQFQNIFNKYDFLDKVSTGNKEIRFNPVSIRMQNYPGTWHVLSAPWNEEYFSELELFPDVLHDDQADATSGAYYYIVNGEPTSETQIVEMESHEKIHVVGDLRLRGDHYEDQD